MLLDLNYDEESQAEVNFNVVITDKNEFLEIQKTADSSLFLAQQGIDNLFRIQS